MTHEPDSERIENPVLRVLAAVIIGQSWIWAIVVAGVFVSMIVFGTTLARVLGAVLLVALVTWVWRDVRRA